MRTANMLFEVHLTRGYFWLTLFNAVCYLVLLTVILYFNARESSTTESIAMP